MILTLKDINEKKVKIKSFGQKAERIIQLWLGGYNIPKTCILSGDTCVDLLKKHGSLYQIDASVNEIKNDPQIDTDKLITLFDKVKKQIYMIELSSRDLKDIEMFVENIFNSNGSVSVRSSSSFEDEINSSNAGKYASVNYCKHIDQIVNAIKMVWISYFKEIIFSRNMSNNSISTLNATVIIQETIDGDMAGVSFSEHPENTDVILIEASKASITDITSGNECEFSLCYNKKTGKVENLSDSVENVFLNIVNITSSIEKYLSFPIDIEWVIRDNVLYIIQARPIVLRKKRIAESGKIINLIFDECDIDNVFYGSNDSAVRRFVSRKLMIGKKANDNAIRFGNRYYIRIDDNTDLFEVENVLKGMNEETLLVSFTASIEHILIKKQNIVPLYKKMKLSNQDIDSMLLAEFIPSDYAISSTILKDKIYIEVSSGNMSLVNKGLVEPCKYWLDIDGKIIEKHVVDQDLTVSFKEGTNNYSVVPSNNLKEFNESYLSDVIRLTKRYVGTHLGVRLEWHLWKGIFFLLDEMREDDSEFNRDLFFSRYNSGTMFYQIDDDKYENVFRELSRTNNVHIDRSDIDLESIKDFINIRNEILELKNIGNKIILVSRRPYAAFSFFIDCIDGMIFEKGSLLCHLAIIAREKNVPFCFINGCMEKMNTCESIYSFLEK